LLLHQEYYSKAIKPINNRNNSIKVPEDIHCHNCNAPHNFLYFNNGCKKSQFKCKICSETFIENFIESKTKFICPYCNHALFLWKEQIDINLYKCGNYECSFYLKSFRKLNPNELTLYKKNPGHFALHYIYRECNINKELLKHSEPDKPTVDLSKSHNSLYVIGLVLTFLVSFAISARKTALLLKWVFNINISYQTVLNYANSASYYCHNFNMKYKGDVDDFIAGDETYIKVKGQNNFIWFFISDKKRSISAYHYSDNRGIIPAITSLNEAKRTAKTNQQITFITDGNPSYPAALQYLNSLEENKSQHHKVIGLQNLDKESEEYRPFKQIVERLNRTYKSHVKQTNGFNSSNGAIALTTLFVTFYNFLRPHMSLNYNVPVKIDFLDDISTIQDKWIKILSTDFG
jgi:transposase-like protein/DNA-directed RNA polymerase subunit RPC12/RpoP